MESNIDKRTQCVATAFPLCLLSLTAITGILLSSIASYADNDSVVDEVNITVPVSCTISGTGMNTHNATINNGQYNSAIGETTMKAFCNDAEGFAVYAIGYTDNTDGKNVLTNSGLGSTYDIETGTSTSGNDSQWGMKLFTITSPEPTYPIQIQNSFTSFQEVPDDYTLVAKRESGTDIGQSAEGSTIKSTYQAYISKTQPAGTYTGQVKYTLVHPNYVDSTAMQNTVTVVFDGNDLTFPDGSTTNTVKYAYVCQPGNEAYVGGTATISKTSNIANDGTMDSYNMSDTSSEDTVIINGADKLKVVLTYGYDNDGWLEVYEGGDSSSGNYHSDYWAPDWTDSETTSEATFFVEGDTVSFYSYRYDDPATGYYGYYAKVYPVYNTEQPGTTAQVIPSTDCSIISINGTYEETTSWKGKWTVNVNDRKRTIRSETDLLVFLDGNYEELKGSTLNLTAFNPYTILYNGNGASNEFGMGRQKEYERGDGYHIAELELGDSISLIAPNYKRIGYGFIGWSTDPDAANHINDATIYGPNEAITIDSTLLSTTNNEHEILFYATWLYSSGLIQNWTGCPNLNIGDVTALTDSRDNNTYAVAKLADENCWMIENLRLGGNEPINLTLSDTQSAGVLPAATSVWGSNSTAQNLDAENTLSPPAVVDATSEQRNYAYGNYYSFATAVNTTAEINYDEDIISSICPSGWGLRRNNHSFPGGTELTAFPNNYVYSGYYGVNTNNPAYGGFSNSNQFGVFGLYLKAELESSYSNNISPYAVGGVSSSTHHHKYEGYAIRCLVQ